MKKLLVIAMAALAGCASLEYQHAACEEKHADLKGVVACLHSNLSTTGRYGPEHKLYLMKADQLAKRVDAGEVSEADARLELQQLQVSLKQSISADKARAWAVINTGRPATPINCTTLGATTTCR